MKNILIIIGLLLCFAIFAFSDDDNAVEKTLEISEFTQLEIKLPCEVFVRQSDKQSLKIVTDEETLSKINASVTDGILRISIEKWAVRLKRNKIKVYVATKSLERIHTASAASLTLEKNTFALKNISMKGASSIRGETKTDALDLEVSGASKIRFDIKADVLNVNLTGASSMFLSGHVAKQYIDVSSASKIDASELKGDGVNIRGSGASKIRLDIKADVLNVNLSGASSMFLSGHVAKQYMDVSGASKIDAAALKGDGVNIKGGGASKITVGTPVSHISVSGATQVSKQ